MTEQQAKTERKITQALNDIRSQVEKEPIPSDHELSELLIDLIAARRADNKVAIRHAGVEICGAVVRLMVERG